MARRVVVFSAVMMCLLVMPLCADDDPTEAYYVKERSRMVKQDLIGRGITNELVLKVMNAVPREDYVLDRYRHRAYADSPLPIEEGQTISQPYIVAAMTEALLPEPDFVVLEIGTGSGYQAAVLAEIVRHVYTIEIVESLAIRAERQLKSKGYSNITVRAGDGYQGWAEHAPFDAIVVTAAPDHVPEPLVQQLKPGGRMVIPVGARWATQELLVIEKEADGVVRKLPLMPVRFVPLTGDGNRAQTERSPKK